MYGLWSLTRMDWMLDPMSDDDPSPPLRFTDVMVAIDAAAKYHFSFHVLPCRMDESGEPNRHDLEELTGGT